MSSVFAVNSNEEGGSIIPDVEEFTEFHPDQLSSLVDIQEELEKLRDVNIEEVMSTVEDVEVVGREVTIRGDQSSEGASILPDIQEEPMILDQDVSLSDVVMEETVEVGETVIEETVDFGESVIEEIIDVEDSVIEETVFGEPVIEETVGAGETLIEETVEVGETVIEEIIDVEDSEIEETVGEICAIGVSKKSVDNVRNTVGSSHSKVLSPVSVGRGPPPLKAIRPVTEALVANKKNSSFITMAQPKKKMMTRVIFSPNSDAAPDAPIIYGEAGGQAIRFIGPNKKIITNSPKTITLAQAKEMGLISSKNIHQFHKAKGLVKKGVMVGGNKFAMLKASPTKILPLPGQLHPIAPSPTMAGPPQKVFIRQGGTIKTGTLSGTFITTSGSAGTQNHILQLPQDNNQLHPLQLPGKQVQFVRLVNSATTPSVPPPLEAITTAPSTISPKPSNNTQLKMLSLAPTQSSSASKNVNSFERVMVSPGLNGKQDGSNVVMVPTEYVKPYKPHTVTPSPPPPPVPPPPLLVKPTPAVSKASNMSGLPPPSPAYKAKEVSSTKEHFTVKAAKVTEPPNGIRPRKPCNCTKSQCLKLYCDCFANGEFCHECNCNCCYNNLNHEEERQRAIKACLDRNPAAFRPKIGKGYIGNERRHNKGCNCKRSGCLKNYCECYEAKIPCSNNCKCIGCRNVEDNREVRNRSSHEGNRMYQQLAVKHKLSTEIQESAFMPQSLVMNQVARQPFNLMTQEVVEATCQCLLAQVEGEGQLNEHVERLIIEEFGRCLVEIIDCATRTSVNNSTT